MDECDALCLDQTSTNVKLCNRRTDSFIVALHLYDDESSDAIDNFCVCICEAAKLQRTQNSGVE